MTTPPTPDAGGSNTERDEAIAPFMATYNTGGSGEFSVVVKDAVADELIRLNATIATLAAQLAAAKALLQRVPSALNSAFAAGAEEREHGSARRQERCMEPVYALRADIRTALADAARTGAR